MTETSLVKMASTNCQKQLHNDDSSDSDYSSESNPSIEPLPSTGNRDSPEKPLIKNIKCFNSAVDGRTSKIQDKVDKLTHITNVVEEVHRKATIQSLFWSVITAAGGIIMIVGFILAPFSLVASLIVTGLGVGASAAGILARTASNITEKTKKETSRKEIETILEELKKKLSPLNESLRGIELRLNEIPRAKPADPTTPQEQIAFAIFRGIGYVAEAIRLIIVVAGLDTEADYVSRAVIATGVITGALAGLFFFVDLFVICYYVKQIREMNKERRNGNGKSAISKFINGMKETVDHLNQILHQLQSGQSSVS